MARREAVGSMQRSRAGWFVAGGLVAVAVGYGLVDEIGPGPDPQEVARRAWDTVGQDTRDTMCLGMRTVPGSMRQMLTDTQDLSAAEVDATLKILAEEC